MRRGGSDADVQGSVGLGSLCLVAHNALSMINDVNYDWRRGSGRTSAPEVRGERRPTRPHAKFLSSLQRSDGTRARIQR
jgi:hypothetical protein